MAERIVSPGVFTQENDLSFLPVGIGEIGAVIIGNTESGPAFVPTQVRSMNEFELKFGSSTKGTYVPFTVKEYIKNAGVVTIVRTLGLDGFNVSSQVFLVASGSSLGPSGSTVNATTSPFILGVLHASTVGDTSNKDGTMVESGVTNGTVSPGNKATGSFALAFDDANFPTDFELQVGTSDSDEVRFMAASLPLPADTGNIFFFNTGSNTVVNGVIQLAAEINAHSTTITANQEGAVLHLTASTRGTAGNDLRVQTGSGTGFSTQVTLAGGTADTLVGCYGC